MVIPRKKNPFDKPGAADFFLRLFKFFLAPAAPKLFPATYGRLKLFLAPAAPEIFPAGGTPQNKPIFFPCGRGKNKFYRKFFKDFMGK